MLSFLDCAPESWTSDTDLIGLPVEALWFAVQNSPCSDDRLSQCAWVWPWGHSDWLPLNLKPLWLGPSDLRPLWLVLFGPKASSPFLRLLGLWLGLFCSPGWNGSLTQTHGVYMEIALFLACLISHLVQTPSENHEAGSQIKEWA